MKRGLWTGSYFGLVRTQNFLGHFLLLIVRLYWGALLVMTGVGKWVHLDQVSEFFGSIGIPAPLFMATLVGLVELVGGAALFLGLFSRVMSLLLASLFFSAYATAHTEALMTFFVSPQQFFDATPFLYLYATLLVFCFGPGFISFDYWLERSVYGSNI
ncbi:MAG: DoxX family protein [Chlamydiales bacterium]